MLRQYNAADLFAVSSGERTLHAEPRVTHQPSPRAVLKPAVVVKPLALPTPRKRPVSAADILAISQHAQPWQALKAAQRPLRKAV